MPKGPLYGKLVRGETVQSASGAGVRPEQVRGACSAEHLLRRGAAWAHVPSVCTHTHTCACALAVPHTGGGRGLLPDTQPPRP